MDRREFLKVSALTGTTAFAWGVRMPEVLAIQRSASTLATGHCLWGAHAEPRGTENFRSAITNLEGMIGRGLAISRHYVLWESSIPDRHQVWSAQQGRLPYVSWHAVSRREGVSWGSIAAGLEDAWIRVQARSVAQAGFPILLCFHHEPENDTSLGDAAQFVGAYERVRSVFASEAVTNVTWVTTLMRTAFVGGHGGHEAWLPSDFDLLGVDGYNRYAGREWSSFATMFGPARDAAVALGKGLVIGEFGCAEHGANPEAKAAWFTDAGATIKSWPEVTAAVYSHSYSAKYRRAYWVDTSPTSLSSFETVGLDPYFA
jgi:hypothetical protein